MIYDLVIIGAGPVGLAAAIEAKRNNLSFVIVEKGLLVNSLYHFPTNMVFFTTAKLLEIGNHPFPSTAMKPTRLMALDYYRLVAENENLEIFLHYLVESITSDGNNFEISGKKIKENNEQFSLKSTFVMIATGYYDNPRGLGGIPGENLSHVSYYYKDPHPYFRKKVVVVGAGNSGAEASLELYRHGADVTLIHRHEDQKPTVKYWVAPDLKNRLQNGEIKSIMPGIVIEISDKSVKVKSNNEILSIDADQVFIFTGFTPNLEFLHKIKLKTNEQLKLKLTECYETEINGMFAVGSVGFGQFTNAVFIENGRFHAKIAVSEMASRIQIVNYTHKKSPLKNNIKPTNQ